MTTPGSTGLAFDPKTGLRAAIFVVTPLVVGAATGYLFQGLLATIGANFLTNTEGSGPSATSLRMLGVACLVEPAAMALGTLAGTTGILAIPSVSLGVFFLLMTRSSGRWIQVGLIGALVFVVGVGLPGDTPSSSLERLWALMAGDLWALLGIAIQWRSRSATRGADGPAHQPQDQRHIHPFHSGLSVHTEVFGQAVVTAIAAGVGLAIGVTLHLPRDIWIMITIIIAIRPGIGPTINSTIVIVVGTVLGAMLGAAVTLEVGGLAPLAATLFVLAFGMFSARLVNQALFQALVTPFLIVLLNIIYPGDWWFAFARIADVGIGGALAIAAVYLHYVQLTHTGSREPAGLQS